MTASTAASGAGNGTQTRRGKSAAVGSGAMMQAGTGKTASGLKVWQMMPGSTKMQ